MDIKKYREWINEESSEKELLEETKLSEYWKKRARARAKNAGRPLNNSIDRKWALEEQEKSRSIDEDLHNLFQKELQENEEMTEEITVFLDRVKKKYEEYRTLEEKKKKARLEKAKGKRGKKTLPNPYAGEKTTKKFPYGGGKDGGVAKVYKKRMRKAGGMTLAPGEAFGSIAEATRLPGKPAANPFGGPTSSDNRAAMKAFGMLPSSNKSSSNSPSQMSFAIPGMARDTQKEFEALNNVQKNNFYKLSEDVPRYDIDGFTTIDYKNALTEFDLEIEHVIDLLKNCKTLREVEIDGPLFAGTKGITYNLKNDHVLKLFTSGYQDDLAWYSDLRSKVYKGDGSVMELHVYDSGDIDIPGRKGKTVKFAEMEKLVPFGTFIKNTGRSKSIANVDLDNIVYAVTSIYDFYKGDDDNEFFLKVNAFLKKHYKKNRRRALTKKESYQFIRMLKSFIDRGNMPKDMHSGNIGFLPQSNPADPVFVIFDN